MSWHHLFYTGQLLFFLESDKLNITYSSCKVFLQTHQPSGWNDSKQEKPWREARWGRDQDFITTYKGHQDYQFLFYTVLLRAKPSCNPEESWWIIKQAPNPLIPATGEEEGDKQSNVSDAYGQINLNRNQIKWSLHRFIRRLCAAGAHFSALESADWRLQRNRMKWSVGKIAEEFSHESAVGQVASLTTEEVWLCPLL